MASKDVLCVVPLTGGLGGGPGSVVLEPGRRAFVRLGDVLNSTSTSGSSTRASGSGGSGDGGSFGGGGIREFQMKVYKPGFAGMLDRLQYSAPRLVRRGDHVSLRTNDCDLSADQNLTT